MHVPGDQYYIHLGFSWLSLVFLVLPVIGFVIRRKWRLAVARKEEIKRLLILASEEAARAEREAATGYYGTVSASAQLQCAVCYCPTTTRCARCKSVRYCSGKCQIIHWRQGHKEECYPSSTSHQIIDDGSNSSQNAVKQEQRETFGNTFETEGRQFAKPVETFLVEPVLSNFSHPPEVPCGKDDDIKVEFLADAKGTNSTSNSSSASFSAGFSTSNTSSTSFSSGFTTSTTTNESFDDVSVSESIGSNDLDKLDEHHSADIAPDTVETASKVNNVDRNKPLSAEFNNLVDDAVYSSTSSRKSNQIKSSCGDGETQHKSTSSSVSGINDFNDCSVAESSSVSNGFWGKTLDSSWSRNDAHDDSAQSNSTRAGDLSNSESFLRFSFNLSGNTIPPLQSLGSEAKDIVSDDAHRASLGINKPIDGATLSKNINVDTSKFEKLPSSNSEKSSHMDNDTSPDSHILRSKEVRSRSSSSSYAHPSCSAGGEFMSTDPLKVTSMPSLSSKRSNHVINSTSSTTHLLKSREVGSLSSASDAHLYSSNGGHSFPSVKTGKVDGIHPVASISSQIASYSPNASNGLKTSMRKVVDQFKASKLSKHCSLGVGSEIAGRYSGKGLFSYELFVKLYIWNKVELRPCGLKNCGNSCYANVVLQCLAFTPPLTAYLLQGLHSKACVNKEWCFTCEFQSLILKAKEGNSPLSPIGILSQIQNIGSHLGNGREEDAHEFLRYAIDTMQSVCIKEAGVNASGSLEEETTLVGLTFGGYLRSKIRCMKCLGKSERHERMMDLTVEIEGDIGTLDEALRQFTRTEILDGENKYRCNRCKSYEKAKKKLTVLEAPNVLTIALKRFQSGKFGKLNKSIEFPEILDLAPYMSGTSDKSPIYRLYGVVVHLDIMNAAFSGHYVCYVKNNQNKWFKIDDSSVKAVELERVLKKGAYMLLYTRCSPRAPRSIRNSDSLYRDPKIKIATSKLRLPSTNTSVIQANPSLIPSDRLASQESHSRHPKETIPEADSSSDNFSIFSSCSDEGSCSTRDSTSTDDLSDCIFGDSGRSWKSHWRNSSDSDASSSSSSPSPLYSRHSPLADLERYASGSQSQTDYADSVAEGDGLWARLTGEGSRPEDSQGMGSIPFLHSNTIKQCRKLDSTSGSSRETDSERLVRVNPYDDVKFGVSCRRSTRERTG